MNIIMFYHSLISDWNHGNAHFLRGVVSELMDRGHNVTVYEPAKGWSLTNLMEEYGDQPVDEFHKAFPHLKSIKYGVSTIDIDKALEGSDLVIVHEWNDHSIVKMIGEHRKKNPTYKLLFHDTHHRSVTAPESMAAYDLSNYDGVLAFGKVIEYIYKTKGLAENVWTWHEAADVRTFHPIENIKKAGDVVWIGNWGDEERTAEIMEFLIKPVHILSLKTRIYGVRYPDYAVNMLREMNIEYPGWIPNYRVPHAFARFKLTVHIPRKPYVQALPGIPTIRPFEALACGIPLISAPWEDIDHLFTVGNDYLVAQNAVEMQRYMKKIVFDPDFAFFLSENGRKTILQRHTCAHRVNELMAIYNELTEPANK